MNEIMFQYNLFHQMLSFSAENVHIPAIGPLVLLVSDTIKW